MSSQPFFFCFTPPTLVTLPFVPHVFTRPPPPPPPLHTVGCKDEASGKVFKQLFDTPTFAINVVSDVAGVELCGAMKNVVALGAGFCDGLGYGGNTKAAIVRIGLGEMQKFCALFFEGVQQQTFIESCGVADLITTCYGGRNRKCAEAFAKATASGKPTTWEELETEMLNGQKLQGTITSKDVQLCLASKSAEGDFPLFCMINKIAFHGEDPKKVVQLS